MVETPPRGSDRAEVPIAANSPRIGVLALQGDFIEHIHVFNRMGVEAVEVRKAAQLSDLDGLVIPGGESTDDS